MTPERAAGRLLLVALASCAPSEYELQRRFAERLRPPAWADVEPSAPVRTMRVRVYADPDHRAAIQGWSVRFFKTVKRANPILRRTLGLELEVTRVKEWPRERTVGGLRPALSELAAFDPGEDADIVVGLVGPLDAIGRPTTELGIARLFGKHLVLRAQGDVQLYEALERRLNRLGPEARAELYEDMREHREAVVLLHEIGHLFGGLHVDEDVDVMAQRVSSKQADFHPANLALMRIMAQNRPLTARLIAYRQALVDTEAGVFALDDRPRMIALLDSGQGRLATADTLDLYPQPAADHDPRAPVTDDVIVQRAMALASRSPDAAWIMLLPVLERHPNAPKYQELGCRVALGRSPKSDETLRRCSRAVQLAPATAAPRIWRAIGYLRREEPARARADAETADRLLTRTSTSDPQEWAALARLYRALSQVEGARRAAKRADDPELKAEIEAWADRQTARAAGRPSCRRLVESRKWKAAWKPCRAEAKRAPKSADAQTLVAVVAFGLRRPAAAIRPLERVVRLDPERKDAWRLLKAAYAAAGRVEALQKLDARYRQRFNEAL